MVSLQMTGMALTSFIPLLAGLAHLILVLFLVRAVETLLVF